MDVVENRFDVFVEIVDDVNVENDSVESDDDVVEFFVVGEEEIEVFIVIFDELDVLDFEIDVIEVVV